MFTEGFGFVVDYLAEILRTMRNYDFSHQYEEHFTLSSDISTRDRDGINKTFSGLMKIIYPHGQASPDEIEQLLIFAIEGRKRVKDQLMRIDTTYADVRFGYQSQDGTNKFVKTLEEQEFPQHYYHKARFAMPVDQEPLPETVQPVSNTNNYQLQDLDKRIEQIELSLRKLVEETIGDDLTKIPQHILKKVDDRINSTLNNNASMDPSYYQTAAGKLEFFDIRNLEHSILNRVLWPDFEPIFRNKDASKVKFHQLAELRNTFRHSRTVNEVTLKEGEAAILWFEKVLEK